VLAYTLTACLIGQGAEGKPRLGLFLAWYSEGSRFDLIVAAYLNPLKPSG
jgi:hypothetical protein